ARQGQSVRRHRERCGAVGKGRGDEGRKSFPVLRKAVVEIERGRDAVGQVRGQQIGLEADRRKTALAEFYSRVIHSVTAADGVPVSQSVRKTGPRAPGVLVR